MLGGNKAPSETNTVRQADTATPFVTTTTTTESAARLHGTGVFHSFSKNAFAVGSGIAAKLPTAIVASIPVEWRSV